LKKLLADIVAKRVRVVVVYKVDRLTRSLADFAKLVELFDAHGVSFVSVTQAFNTTTSMGRLTLNVPLSFAQFEREVTGERIRDKIAASKKKGMWMGGFAPIGYLPHERTLVIDEEQAGWRQLPWRPCCLTKECYRRLVVVDIGFSISRGRRLWACGRRAPAVGNARRAAPVLSTVGARCAEGASSICPQPAGRAAPGPRGRASFSARFDFKAQAACSTTLRSWPRTRSFAFSARQALMRRCSVRNCALLA
jgi:hypothetical protein